jgi:hypothetical protein
MIFILRAEPASLQSPSHTLFGLVPLLSTTQPIRQQTTCSSARSSFPSLLLLLVSTLIALDRVYNTPHQTEEHHADCNTFIQEPSSPQELEHAVSSTQTPIILLRCRTNCLTPSPVILRILTSTRYAAKQSPSTVCLLLYDERLVRANGKLLAQSRERPSRQW